MKNWFWFLLISSLTTIQIAKAEVIGEFTFDLSEYSAQIRTTQEGNTLQFKCDIENTEIQTIVDTQHFFAYNDDPSLLIFELNGLHHQLSGDGSDSKFKSCFNCDNDNLHTILNVLNSSADGTLNLEAISLSSGLSSRVSFEIKNLDEAIFELQKSCHQLSLRNNSIHFKMTKASR
ncbi:hypothetical protein [Shewanella kaireitica]|uniref:hypothetical protein n=1 Tax=Shewanella kaireitica TaxID=212021 RepID=UPI00200D0E82|nr:hypothetical protein [Shewanella kaireitica]MCL1092282.1 hypothetical protein [Shewanella kaireitica]